MSLPASRQHDLVRLDVGVLADEGAVDERLVLEKVVKSAEHVRLVVVPPQRVVLAVVTVATAAGRGRAPASSRGPMATGLGLRRGGR